VDESLISLDSMPVTCRVNLMIGANIIEKSITIFVYKTLSKAQHTSILNCKKFQDYSIQKLKIDILFSLEKVTIGGFFLSVNCHL
jgi:hypothetical protein